MMNRTARPEPARNEAAHREVPPEQTAAIRAGGARSWEIWRSGTELLDVAHDYSADGAAAGLPLVWTL